MGLGVLQGLPFSCTAFVGLGGLVFKIGLPCPLHAAGYPAFRV